MPDHIFKLKVGVTTNDCKVELDGKELTGVTRVSFELNANSLTTIKLEIMGEILMEGEFRESAILHVEQGNADGLR